MRDFHSVTMGLLLGLGLSALPAFASPLRISVLGDSLVAGYGLPVQQAFPAQLEAALKRRGHAVVVENAGVSGDTSAGGLARLDWTLATNPQLMIVELGANDALRGLDPAALEQNLDRILTRLRQAGVLPLLAGMRAPRNLGPDYYNRFDQLYPALAEKHQIALYPFFLEGVAGRAELNLADGIHPNAAGVQVIVEKILPLVESLLQKIPAQSPSSALGGTVNSMEQKRL
jgi:acyl-CoA thioesterase-1